MISQNDNTISNLQWNGVIKKEARGINDEDLREVQRVEGNYVMVQKGIINKEKFITNNNYH